MDDQPMITILRQRSGSWKVSYVGEWVDGPPFFVGTGELALKEAGRMMAAIEMRGPAEDARKPTPMLPREQDFDDRIAELERQVKMLLSDPNAVDVHYSRPVSAGKPMDSRNWRC